MTNKKFKLAAMSLALTACVAASPLAANAETGAEATSSTPAVETPAPAAEPSGENAPATNETKQESTNESKQNPADETKQNPADETKPEVAVENKALAEAPAAKAPVLMTAALAKAPAAPTTPAEDNTVATITGQDGKTTGYTSFDEAVSKANNGDTIEVIKDATSTGIDLRNKKLTIKGKTVTTTTDSGTEEKTTVKPKLKFVAKEGKSQIAGITLWGSDLTFQNMDVDMTGASSTTYNKWNAVCMSDNAALTLNNTDLLMDGKDLDASAQGIYMAGRGRNELNVDDHSTLTINNYYNAIAWDGVADNNKGSNYFINITDGSTFTADGNDAGIIGRESLDVLVDNSTLTVTNCTGRSGFNGADVKIVNGSTANISSNHEGYGIHANDLLVENSTLTANNNGYGGIRITGKGEFTNSTVTVTGTENKGNASVEIACGIANETRTGPLNGSLSVRNSTLNISDNNATGIACRTSKNGQFHSSLTIDDASRVTIQNNNATPKNGYNPKGDSTGGGLRIEEGSTAVLGRNTVINNNTAKSGGGVYTKGGKVTINKSTITENKATGNGGGICAEDNSTVTIDGGKVIGNTTTNGNGGGIYAKGGTVTAANCDISDNDAGQYNGGGIGAQNSTLTLEKNTLNRNKSKSGGAIWMNASDATLTGNTIDHNAVTGSGGGIYAYGDTNRTSGNNTITLEGNTITYNTSKGTGGGIHLANANQIMTSLHDTIEYNEAASYGGGVHVASGSELLMNGGSISYNNAKVGGGIYHASAKKPITLNGVTVKGNTANSGAGAYLWASGATLVVGEDTLISENQAKYNGGGIYGGQRAIIAMRTGALYNNHAGSAGDDLYLKEKSGSKLILRPVGDDWILDDCGHPIDGWYLDGKDARWDADSQKKFVTNLDALLEGTDYEIEKGEDGCYIITIGSNALALKAAHNAPSEPKPDPDGPDTPNPNPNPKPEPKPGPDTPVTPEDPQLPPVQDARADDTPDSPVLPANPTNPAVQDAHALPQTGTSLFAALAMALSGFALTIAGAWASLLGKNSRH